MHISRDPQPELFNNDYFYEQALYALEQDNFCDFEIQFEVLHNALHSWLGGHAKYSFSSLDYTAFDPAFFLHHANTDRWVGQGIWLFLLFQCFLSPRPDKLNTLYDNRQQLENMLSSTIWHWVNGHTPNAAGSLTTTTLRCFYIWINVKLNFCITIEGKTLNQVTNLRYLGTVIILDERSIKEIKSRMENEPSKSKISEDKKDLSN